MGLGGRTRQGRSRRAGGTVTPAEPPSVSIPLPDGARFDVWHEHRLCATIYPSGRPVTAIPHDTDEYRATAARVGLTGPQATWLLTLTHELGHSLVGWPRPSPVLWALAHGQPADLPEHYEEESHVMAAQAALVALLKSFRPAP